MRKKKNRYQWEQANRWLFFYNNIKNNLEKEATKERKKKGEENISVLPCELLYTYYWHKISAYPIGYQTHVECKIVQNFILIIYN